MSQFDKLLQRIKSLDKNMRFAELQKVLEHYGYAMSGPSSGSSHRSFRKKGKSTITIPQHNPVKRAYVEAVKAIVERIMMKTLEYYLSLPYRMEIIPDMEEGGYTATFPDLPGCLTCAETIEELVACANDAKKVWIAAALEDGIEIFEPQRECDHSEYSGQFKLRMPRSLHKSLSTHAKEEGISMNQYCLYLLAKNDAVYSAKAITV